MAAGGVAARPARVFLLVLICALAFTIRLFAVVRYESIIHEYDPHFNFRATVLLVERGPAELWNWFDGSAWYPLGRAVGDTVYPALPLTAGLCWWLSRTLFIPVSVRSCCVFLPPLSSAVTCLATYCLTQQVVRRGAHGAGLYAAAFVAVVPAYLSRSSAGAYDNESVAIPALVVTFALYLTALNTPGGSVLWATLSAAAYGYMVMAWGGYVFVTNLLALHCAVLVMCGRYSHRLYIAYSVWHVLGGLLAAQVPFVRNKTIGSSEHLAAHIAFGLVQVRAALPGMASTLHRLGVRPVNTAVVAIAGATLVMLTLLRVAFTKEWGGDSRLQHLLDPTRAAASIVSSVAEHQPARWLSLFKDLHLLQIFFPPGLILLVQADAEEHCIGGGADGTGDESGGDDRDARSGGLGWQHDRPERNVPSDAKLFALLFGVSSMYFAGIMVRCSLIFAPAACVISGIAVSRGVEVYSRWVCRCRWRVLDLWVCLSAAVVLLVLLVLTCLFVQHGTWMAASVYSSPSVVMDAEEAGAHLDDFREAYSWLRSNTAEDAKILSWWDYGYQLASLANRTTFVDNNTWNNTHIAAVGRVLASSEQDGARLMREMGADHLMLVFGGAVGFASDDLGKMLWPVRIASGVFPDIRESDYLNHLGQL